MEISIIKLIISAIFFIFFSNIKYTQEEPLFEKNEIDTIWKDITTNEKQNQLRRYMIFEINEDEIKNPDYFIRILTDFFLSNGYQSGLYNIKNKIFLSYLSKTDDIKIKAVRDYFGNAFKKIYWFNKNNKDHDFRKLNDDL